jgi:CPA1 family monovalent cation:H+ antiporter
VADRLHLSGVLTIVTFAIVLSRRPPVRMPPALRVPSYAVWETVVFLLNALAFVLVGLQMGPILSRIGSAQQAQAFTFAGAVLLAVVLARFLWVFTYNRSLWLINLTLGQHIPRALAVPTPPLKRSLVVSWCGMRGIVTLAAALALPDGSNGLAAFPYRDLIVLTAFTVVIGTLVVQGLTLRPLLMMLRLEDDEAMVDETRLGREEMLKAAFDSVDQNGSSSADAIRREYSQLLGRVDGTGTLSPQARLLDAAMRQRARTAARERLNQLRLEGAIGDSTYQQLEAELDMYELSAEASDRW